MRAHGRIRFPAAQRLNRSPATTRKRGRAEVCYGGEERARALDDLDSLVEGTLDGLVANASTLSPAAVAMVGE